MKKTFLILFLVFSIFATLIIFVVPQSEQVAGQVRKYTLYEEYKSKEKVLDFSMESYVNDIYNLQSINNDILQSYNNVQNYREQLVNLGNSFFQDVYNIEDYERINQNLDELKIKFDNEKQDLEFHRKNLNELSDFIVRMERGKLSIKMYILEIANVNSSISAIDTLNNRNLIAAKFLQNEALTKKINLIKIIERRKIEEEQRKENEYLAQLEKEREIEKRKNSNSNLKKLSIPDIPINTNSNYRSSIYYSPPKYYSSPSYPDYYVPSIPNYPSTYEPSTNPNAAPATVEVKGYQKANGTQVAPHVRTPPNSTKTDNLRYP